jgi:hypothetical protein
VYITLGPFFVSYTVNRVKSMLKLPFRADAEVCYLIEMAIKRIEK